MMKHNIAVICIIILGLVMMIAAKEQQQQQRKDKKHKYDHFVVIMFENRSFDHMLGYVSDKWNGVLGKNITNPIPKQYQNEGKTKVPTGITKKVEQPLPDPGHAFTHVNTQVFESIHPPENEKDPKHPKSPYNRPVDGEKCTMNGFVTDYIIDHFQHTGRYPTYENYSQIMNSFTAETLPVMSTIAKGFNVADNYFCSVPSKTEPNRLFFAAAESNGFVNNHPMDAFMNFTGKTMFEVLEEHNISWKIYYDAEQILSVTYLLLFARLKDYFSKTAYMAQFYRDAAAGNLPQFAFIEPLLTFNFNDMHPAHFSFGGHSSVAAGEILLHRIYEAIRTSNSTTGSNYANTLFMTTFDEHGGLHDHVCPPKTNPPHPSDNPGEMEFNFDRLGIRVPSIFVSAYAEEHSVTTAPLQHTSVIKTIFDRFDIKERLTERDAAAPPFPMDQMLSRDTPRDPKDWPRTHPNPLGEPIAGEFVQKDDQATITEEQLTYYHYALSAMYHVQHPRFKKYQKAMKQHQKMLATRREPQLRIGDLKQIFYDLKTFIA